MSPTLHSMQPLSCWRKALRKSHLQPFLARSVSAGTLRYRNPPAPLPPPDQLPQGMSYEQYRNLPKTPTKIRVHAPPQSATKTCSEPIKLFNTQQIALLDPSTSRTKFLSPDNPDAARVGDLVLVRFKSGDPFAGVMLSIRRRGQDTSILLRSQVSRVAAEMQIKVYSPLVVGMEIVQRKERKARRARLYYMRKPKHDRGSLDKIVAAYVKQKKSTGRGMVTAARSKVNQPKQAGKGDSKGQAKGKAK